MRLEEFLKSGNEVAIKKFISTIEIIKQESSGKLMFQLDDRLKHLNRRIEHQQSREASLKRKVDIVNVVLNDAIKNQLEEDVIEVLQGFKSELVSMLDKIDYTDQENERVEVHNIKQRIEKRKPIMKKILGIIENGNTA